MTFSRTVIGQLLPFAFYHWKSSTCLLIISDFSRTNGQTIWAKYRGIDPRNASSSDFLWNLVLQLVSPHIHQRKLTYGYSSSPSFVKATVEYFLTITANDRRKCEVILVNMITMYLCGYLDEHVYHFILI